MYKEIVASLAKDSGLYYKIKNKEEAEWFANTLFNHGYGYSDDNDKFVEWFEGGRDCLIIYKGYEYKDYVLVVENVALNTYKVRYEPPKHIKCRISDDNSTAYSPDSETYKWAGRGAKTIVNPTYDDLKPLFSDTKPKEVEDVDLDIALEYDTVERPKHYNVFEKEVIYTIKDLLDNNNNYKGFDNYCIGNSLKYIFRAGLKGDYYEDLEKARYYINKILEGKESW